MDHHKAIMKSGYAKVNSPDFNGVERFDESVDQSLTNDLEENNDSDSLQHDLPEGKTTAVQKSVKKLEKDIESDLGGFKTI